MKFFKKFTDSAVVDRKLEERLYAVVAGEMENNIRNKGLWLKALERAKGSQEKQVSEYIKLRVQSLKDDMHISRSVNSHSSDSTIGVPALDIGEVMAMIKDDDPLSDLKDAVSHLDDQKLQELINSPDSLEDYLLHASLKKKRLDIATWLLDSGADASNQNYWGNNARDVAANVGSSEALELLDQYDDE